MTVRGLGVVSMLAALAIGGYLSLAQARESGPTSATVERSQAEATSGAAGVSFQAAAPILETWFAEHGTYAGATLPASFGVTVVRADATAYCLQAGAGQAVVHAVGLGGSAAPGPC